MEDQGFFAAILATLIVEEMGIEVVWGDFHHWVNVVEAFCFFVLNTLLFGCEKAGVGWNCLVWDLKNVKNSSHLMIPDMDFS